MIVQAEMITNAQACMLFLVDADSVQEGELFNMTTSPATPLKDQDGVVYRSAMYFEAFCLNNPEEQHLFNLNNDKLIDGPISNMLVIPFLDEAPLGTLVLVNKLSEGSLDPEGFNEADTNNIQTLLQQVRSLLLN